MLKQGSFGDASAGYLRIACVGILPYHFSSDFVPYLHCRIAVFDLNYRESGFAGWADFLDDDDSDSSEHPMYMLPLLMTKPQMWEGSGHHVWGILVRQSASERDKFNRVGSFRQYGVNEAICSHFVKVLEQQGPDTARAVGLEETTDPINPSERFVITIV